MDNLFHASLLILVSVPYMRRIVQAEQIEDVRRKNQHARVLIVNCIINEAILYH